MSDAANDDDNDLPEWWKKLSAEEQAVFRDALGEDWRPSEMVSDVARAFDITRERIRQIEKRALEKLKGKGDDDKK